MSYIGSTPTNQNFIAGTDYFNGTGSAVNFTMSRAVNSVNDIEVMVNNVAQIPSGYSVSGTTLTFSAAPSAGTSNVYVRYLSTTNLSLAIPAGTSATFNTVTATSLTATTLAATTLAVTGVTTIAAGSAAAPALVGATGGATTGVWFPAASTVAFANAGVESARIDSSGNLLVGTTSATSSSRIAVKSSGSGNTTLNSFFQNSAATTLLSIRDDGYFVTGTAANSPYNATTGSAVNCFINTDGGLYRSTSSIKYKTNVQDATHGLSAVLKLRPVTYEGKAEVDAGKTFGGLIAEEVHDAGLTEFVQYAEDGTPDALAYSQMVSLAFKAIQEQQTLITALTARITALEAK